MRTIMIATVTLLAVFLVSGCGPMTIQAAGQVSSEERSVKNFDRVSLSGSGDLILTQGDVESLTVEAPENLLPYIETEVRGDTLYIGVRPDVSWTVLNSKPMRFYLTATDISGLTINGSGDITTEQIETNSLDLAIRGSGSIRIDELDTTSLDNEIDGSGDIYIKELKADDVDTHIIGSGSCSMEGQAADQTVNIGGSGDYQAFDLESETVFANVGGSGSVDVWVNENLKVTIAGSGDVNYYGSPAVSYSVMGSGEIDKVGDR